MMLRWRSWMMLTGSLNRHSDTIRLIRPRWWTRGRCMNAPGAAGCLLNWPCVVSRKTAITRDASTNAAAGLTRRTPSTPSNLHGTSTHSGWSRSPVETSSGRDVVTHVCTPACTEGPVLPGVRQSRAPDERHMNTARPALTSLHSSRGNSGGANHGPSDHHPSTTAQQSRGAPGK